MELGKTKRMHDPTIGPHKPDRQSTGRRLEITGGLLGRNALLNLGGYVLPLLIGVVVMPAVVRGLGTERFGLLTLVWMLLGYFTVFDFGIGKASTKFVSETLGRGEHERVSSIVWSAVLVELFFSVAGAALLVLITPVLVESVLSIPPGLHAEATTTFHLLALSVPVVLISSSLQGALAAAQRFDLLNAVRIPTSSATYLLPMVGLALGLELPGIVTLVILARTAALAALIVLNLRATPMLRRCRPSIAVLPKLFSFGSWIMVSSVISPILVNIERFMIGSALSLSALSFYSAPAEVLMRLLVVPNSLMMTLFPAFSTLVSAEHKERLTAVFARSVKYVLLLLGPVVLLAALFARDLLMLWLGPDFASQSTALVQVQAIGVLINALAHSPLSLLQGMGRPDLPAKFHVLELPIYIGIAWLLVGRLGIVGAAIAWTLRAALDGLLLFIAASRICKLPRDPLSRGGLVRVGVSLSVLAGAAYCVRMTMGSLPLSVQVGVVIGIVGLFCCAIWRYVLDGVDRGVILGVTRWLRSGWCRR